MNDLNTRLDHLVIAADNLHAGVAYIEKELGVTVPGGGEHANMSTHNHVMSLGDDRYLEIIAINPDAPPPLHPRWFGLDDPHIRRSLNDSPRLLTWAVNTSDLPGLILDGRYESGVIHDLQRDDLSWKAALTTDGHMPAAGFLPLAIQWNTAHHPSIKMTDLGCRLERLRLYHSRARWLWQCLESIGAESEVDVIPIADTECNRLEATIVTPSGTRILCSH